jgi:hypothetical protein
MIVRGIHILLIGIVLACPFLCRQGLCDCSDESCETPVDCCKGCHSSKCHEDTPLQDDERFPNNPDPAPCDDCQCLCGGAIRSNDTEFSRLCFAESAVDSLSGVACVMGRPQLRQAIPSQFSGDDGDGNTGRRLREQMMSMLC